MLWSSSSGFPTRTAILGVPVDHVSRASMETWIRGWLVSGPSCAHVATLNPEYVMTARGDAAFAAVLSAAELITIDGVGVAIAVRLLADARDIERVTGVELCWMTAAISADTGARMYLLGAGSGVAEAAAQKLRDALPGAIIAGTWSAGTPHERDDMETIRRIREAGTDILLVAYGAPAQIHWIGRNQAELAAAGVKMVAAVGGALDYLSGAVPWAPPTVRRLGMEWAYRLLREPWRWRRQLVLPGFASLVLRDFLSQRVRGRLMRGRVA